MKKKIRLIAAALILVALISAIIYAYNTVFSAYDGAETRIYIPAGSDADAIADTLGLHTDRGFAARVMMLYNLRGGKPDKARGSYVVTPGTRAWSMASRLITGRQTPVRITFNNIRTLDVLAARISARMAFDADSFMVACNDTLPALGYASGPEFPAAFLPDTYEFYWTDSAPRVIATLVSYTDKFWSAERLGKAKALGLSPTEVATVASIVEEETAKADERPKVARLYLNRLDKGMKLQADPTVKFALGDFTLRRIYGSMLQVSSEYNTYVVDGLPPGPIRIPDRSTIDAVLNAPHHDYLYMCARADFSGYHDFAVDYDTHISNARRYRAALDKRNIR